MLHLVTNQPRYAQTGPASRAEEHGKRISFHRWVLVETKIVAWAFVFLSSVDEMDQSDPGLRFAKLLSPLRVQYKRDMYTLFGRIPSGFQISLAPMMRKHRLHATLRRPNLSAHLLPFSKSGHGTKSDSEISIFYSEKTTRIDNILVKSTHTTAKERPKVSVRSRTGLYDGH